MANIRLQDLTATIAGTSRYNGGKWDTVHVETLLVTDEPLPNDMNWYVPAGVSIPPEALAMFNATGLSMFPTLLKQICLTEQRISVTKLSRTIFRKL